MKQVMAFVWAFFLAAMYFGMWTFVILGVLAVAYGIIYYFWPEFFKKHL